MTQDEVDKIYDYLHENYEYVDGEFFNTNACKKSRSSLGSFFHSGNQQPSIRCGISCGGKKYYKRLSHLVFLFHHKFFPKYIEHLDGNITNCRIENIRNISASIVVSRNTGIKGFEVIKNKSGIRYRVSIATKKNGIKRKMHFGSYDTTEMAKKVYDYAKELFLKEKSEDEIKFSLKERFPEIGVKNYKNVIRGAHKNGIHGWKSQIQINKKTIYLGSYSTQEEAHQAYLKAKEELCTHIKTPHTAPHQTAQMNVDAR